MANTEVLAALRKVRAARNAADTVLKGSLSVAGRAAAQKAWDDLDTLEGDLMLEELKSKLDELAATAEDLGALTGEMEKSGAELEKLAEIISIAAKAVSTLATVVAMAATV